MAIVQSTRVNDMEGRVTRYVNVDVWHNRYYGPDQNVYIEVHHDNEIININVKAADLLKALGSVIVNGSD